MIQSTGVQIHPTAIVDSKAVLGSNTQVGPYSIVGPEVVLGDNCIVQEHVVLRGKTFIGNEATIFPFAAVGASPQHSRYKDEPTTVEIGNRVTIREGATIHRGTSFGLGKTTVGDDAFIMAQAHVAHDCIVGKGAIIVNAVQLAGHVTVEDYATIGGLSAVAQYCRIGRYCYVAGGSIVRKDLLPFTSGKGTDFEIQGINLVGLKRKGFSSEAIQNIKKMHRIFFRQNLTAQNAVMLMEKEIGACDEFKVIRDFIESSKVGFTR